MSKATVMRNDPARACKLQRKREGTRSRKFGFGNGKYGVALWGAVPRTDQRVHKRIIIFNKNKIRFHLYYNSEIMLKTLE